MVSPSSSASASTSASPSASATACATPATQTTQGHTITTRNGIKVTSVSLETFERLVSLESKEVVQGDVKIFPSKKSAHTKGAATCLAIVAHGYGRDLTTDGDKLICNALTHFDGTEPDLPDLFNDLSKKNVSKVSLYVFGGYEESGEDSNFEVLKETINAFLQRKATNIEKINIEYKLINPWKIDIREYNEMAEFVDKYASFGLDVLTKGKEIYICDTSLIAPRSGEHHPLFDRVQALCKTATAVKKTFNSLSPTDESTTPQVISQIAALTAEYIHPTENSGPTFPK